MSKARAAYYFLLIALLMPSLPDNKVERSEQQQPAVVSERADSRRCGAQSGICNAAGYILRKIEAKALYSIYVLQHWPEHTPVGDKPQRA